MQVRLFKKRTFLLGIVLFLLAGPLWSAQGQFKSSMRLLVPVEATIKCDDSQDQEGVDCQNIEAGNNSFTVAPGRADFNLASMETQSFVVANNGEGPIRLSIEPVYFAIDDKSLAAGKSLTPGKKVVDDLRPYMRVSPKSLAIKPGDRRSIRLAIRPPNNLAEGDYRAHLMVKMKETARSVSSSDGTQSKDKAGVNINIKLETAIAIYGRRGDRKPQISMRCSRDKKNMLVVNIQNDTVWRFEGMLKVFPPDAPLDSKPLFSKLFNSLRESQFDLKTNLQVSKDQKIKLYWQDNWEGKMTGQVLCDFSAN